MPHSVSLKPSTTNTVAAGGLRDKNIMHYIIIIHNYRILRDIG